jgi:hypothetical protein
MARADFEKIAETFATQAVLQKELPAETRTKQAAISYDDITKFLSTPAGKYMLGGVGGAGLGALAGAMQPKRKGRNALYYGALGGLGGLGLAAVANNYGAHPPKQPAPVPQPSNEPNRFDAVMDSPNATVMDKYRAMAKDPLDVPGRVAKEYGGLAYDTYNAAKPSVVAGAKRLNQMRLDAGHALGEAAYSGAKGIYDWWNG